MIDKENIIIRFLKFIGLIEEKPVSKKEMCKLSFNICDRECELCAWNWKEERK